MGAALLKKVTGRPVMRLFCGAVLSLAAVVPALARDPEVRHVRTISELPASADEIHNAHKSATPLACELVATDEPFEQTSFAQILTQADDLKRDRRMLIPSSRRHAFGVGLHIRKSDLKDLPLISRGRIVDYLDEHYVSIQSRVYRDPLTRELYLGDRPLAATMSLGAGKTLTQDFTPTIVDAVKNMRSVGLFLPEGQRPTAKNLRTLVMINKMELGLGEDKLTGSQDRFEYVFVRGIESKDDEPTLELHAFATSDDRQRLHWLTSDRSLQRCTDCSVRGAVYFTEYTSGGLIPKSSVIRSSQLNSRSNYGMDELDAYAQKTWGEPWLAHVTEVLDAILAREDGLRTVATADTKAP